MKTQIEQVLEWRPGAGLTCKADQLATEEPLEIQIDTRSIAVTMRTPGHDPELAAGFLLSEGLIRRAEEIVRIEPHPHNPQGNVLNVFLSPKVRIDFARLTRHVFASSSCGLCGKASIASVHQHFKPVRSALTVDAWVLQKLPRLLGEQQEAFHLTGGIYAAAVFDRHGRLIVLREDVGRHNAVDKVLGYGLLNGLLPFRSHVLMVSGRASFEIVQKALAARIPVVAAVSAPSSLAVEFARRSGQTLIGFLRDKRFNVYAGARRIRAGNH